MTDRDESKPPRVRTGVWIFPSESAKSLVDAIVELDAAGIDEVWLADEGVMREPSVVLSAAAALTNHIRLCIGITSPVLRHPGAIGSTMATLDELSHGRAVLGLGLGGQLTLDPFGLRAERPVALLRDAIRVARGVVTRTTVDGYGVPEHAMPDRSVPIFIASRGEQINRMASQIADGVFLSGLDLSSVGTTIGWARSTRPIDVALYPSVRFTTGGETLPANPTALDGTATSIAEQLDAMVEEHRPAAIGLGLIDGDPIRTMVRRAIDTLLRVKR
jgi:alkanesulfonate monooxygenase SsuD/methylene tetrahydromethanopterin reductase-like flavin-dependent oxidoreductase (luciferase family)